VGEVVKERGVVALELELRASVAEVCRTKTSSCDFLAERTSRAGRLSEFRFALVKMAGATSKVSIPYLSRGSDGQALTGGFGTRIEVIRSISTASKRQKSKLLADTCCFFGSGGCQGAATAETES
jgi:hypothetical protein